MKKVNEYPDANVYEVDGVQFNADKKTGFISWMSEWERGQEFFKRGIFTTKSYHTGCYMGYASDFYLA